MRRQFSCVHRKILSKMSGALKTADARGVAHHPRLSVSLSLFLSLFLSLCVPVSPRTLCLYIYIHIYICIYLSLSTFLYIHVRLHSSNGGGVAAVINISPFLRNDHGRRRGFGFGFGRLAARTLGLSFVGWRFDIHILRFRK